MREKARGRSSLSMVFRRVPGPTSFHANQSAARRRIYIFMAVKVGSGVATVKAFHVPKFRCRWKNEDNNEETGASFTFAPANYKLG